MFGCKNRLRYSRGRSSNCSKSFLKPASPNGPNGNLCAAARIQQPVLLALELLHALRVLLELLVDLREVLLLLEERLVRRAALLVELLLLQHLRPIRISCDLKSVDHVCLVLATVFTSAIMTMYGNF